MPNAKTSKTQTKAHFVRSQPSTMSAAEIVEKGKAAEIALSTHYVHKVRAQAKVKTKASKVSKSGKRTKSRTINKTTSKAAFVRANATLSPQEIVAKAKAAGIKLETNYVYNVRGADRTASKKKRKSAKVTKSAIASANGARPSVNPNAENLLKAVAAEIGLGSAIEILSAERARVTAVIAR
jgi:hypothetical protein